MNRLFKYLLIFSVLLSAFLGKAQVNTDSLWQSWNNEKLHDTIRLKAISQMAWSGFMFSNQDSAFALATMQYDFAKKGDYKIYMAIARNSQGVSRALKGKDDEALHFFEECVDINIEAKNTEMAANILNNIGIIHKKKGNYIKAIDYYTQSRVMREENNDTSGIINSLNNISIIYVELKDHENALKLLNRARDLANEHDFERNRAITFNNFGRLYDDMKEYDRAIIYFNKAIDLFERLGDTRSVGLLQGNLAVVYKRKGDPKSANRIFAQSMETGESIGDKEVIGQVQAHLADMIIDSDPREAIALARAARRNAMEVNSRDILSVSTEVLYKALKKVGEHQEALEMYESYVVLNDSLKSEENLREVARQHYKYEYEIQAAADSVAREKERKIDGIKIEKQNQQLFYSWIGLGLIVVFAGFIWNRFRITRKQKALIEDQKKVVEDSNLTLGEKNQEILDSINYAKRIQAAIMPAVEEFETTLRESFVLYLPKDIVAGDFYWLEQVNDKMLFAAADCTGHGVPGAMVSVLCVNSLNRSVREHHLDSPAEILNKTRELVLAEFAKSLEDINDGMDISLCCLKDNRLSWAGANNPLWIIREDELIEYKADKQPVGKGNLLKSFTEHTLHLESGDMVYLFTDGFSDQFGGSANKKYKSANFKSFLLSIASLPVDQQKSRLFEEFNNWKGEHEQLDDLCVIGFRFI